MKKGKLTIILLLCTILVIAFTGCAVTFPKSVDKLLASSNKVWSESCNSIVDTYKISAVALAIPVKIAGIGEKVLRADISKGEISVERLFIGQNQQINLTFANFNVIVDNQLKIYLDNVGISLSKSNYINGNISLLFTPTQLTASIKINNLNLIKSDFPAVYTKEDIVSGDGYPAIYDKIQSISSQTVFGAILNSGKLDKNTNSYAYTLPKESVHEQLLSLPKIMIDAIGGKIFEGSDQSIQTILTKYFNTHNIVDISNSVLVAKDIKVICLLDKTDKHNYIAKLSGNYMGQGSLSKTITEKIFQDFLDSLENSDDIINLLTITSGMTITANMALTSHIKLK